MDSFDRTASELVRSLREGSGMKQAELARRAGMTRSVLCAYESGARQPGVDALARIAGAAGMELALTPAVERVDPLRAGRILEQVLELAEALPYRPRATLDFPHLRDRFA
jgi:transcriptional regulator with XRE-family HTH domain